MLTSVVSQEFFAEDEARPVPAVAAAAADSTLHQAGNPSLPAGGDAQTAGPNAPCATHWGSQPRQRIAGTRR